MELALLTIHLTATVAMTGLIWFVQVVHYPLLAHVGDERFTGYHRLHTELTARVVGPPMLVEALSGAMLLWWRPDALPVLMLYISLALLAIVWASTIWLQVPRHRSLASARGEHDIRALVATNWIRTAAWTARSVLVASMLFMAAVAG